MQELSAVKFVVNRSRFYAHLYSIDDPEEAGIILKEHRRMYKKAAHHCYGLRSGAGAGAAVFKNDGEVGHPGKALLEILNRHGLENHMLVVSRIFGGIKLGPGGVTRAFRDAGEGAVERYLDISGHGDHSGERL